MAKVSFNDREYEAVLNNFTMYHYGVSVGKKTPIEAINTLSGLKDGYTFEGQEKLSGLLHHMTKQSMSLEDCFTAINDTKTLEVIMSEVESYVSAIVPMNEATEKKKTVQQMT